MKVDLLISEIKIQSAHISPFFSTLLQLLRRCLLCLRLQGEFCATFRTQRQGMKHVGTGGVMLFMPRSVQTRKGRLPSGKCYFILNTFPAATISGLFSDTERLAHPPASTTSAGLTPSAVRLPNHSLCYQLHNLYLQLSDAFHNGKASSFLEGSPCAWLYHGLVWRFVDFFRDVP